MVTENENENNSSADLISSFYNYITYYIKKIKLGLFVLIFILFVTNLLAVSLSLKCNKNESVIFKAASALYAFMFGISRIVVNYYMYRIKIKRFPCDEVCGKPFSF